MESEQNLWKAYEAVRKRHLIAHVVGIRRERDWAANNLETKLQLWETNLSPTYTLGHFGGSTPWVTSADRRGREEYRCLLQQVLSSQFRAQQGKLYKVGNKACKLLTWLTRRDEEQRWISVVRNTSGTLVETPGETAQTFADFPKI